MPRFFVVLLAGLAVVAACATLGLAQPEEFDPNTFPNSIAALKRQAFPGSTIQPERQLRDGVNYRQWVVSYRSDGLKIFALLTVPKNAAPKNGWPVVVFNHGYIAPEVYRTTERYVAYQDAFARNGYVVFKSDYRGHGFSQGEPDGAYFSPGYTRDVMNAISSMRAFKGVDAARIGVWGHSMGGYLSLRALVLDKRVRAGVIWAGVVAPHRDIIDNWRRRNPNPQQIPSRNRRMREAFLKTYGTPTQNPAFWDSMSANYFLQGIAPVQLHHGLADATVPFEFSRILKGQLRDAGRSVELFEYPRNDHNLKQSFGVAMRRSIAFFDQHLK